MESRWRFREKHGNEHGAAITYHQLGMIAQERRDLAAAEQWYRKVAGDQEKHGNEHGAAITYHQLGRIAEAAGLRGRRAMVSEVAGDQGKARQRARGGEHLWRSGVSPGCKTISSNLGVGWSGLSWKRQPSA